jgi:hypothetical protein
MDAELLKNLSGLGGAGVLAFAMWQIAKRFIEAHSDQVKITHGEMSKRVDALEKASADCESDRKQLNEKLITILTKKNDPAT